jgi:lysine decarboxylase
MYQQQQIPILQVLKQLVSQPDAAFYAPGHKRGQGISRILADFLGNRTFQADLPELPELDNLFAPRGVIQTAQSLAAEAWGADQTWFLVNGSTCGLIAAILATCGEGDKLLLPRNCHQSAIAGVIHAGVIPIFIEPAYDPAWDLAYSITPETLTCSLQRHPDAKAVLLLYPTYHGVGGNLAQLIKITQAHHLPVIVDEAHAAHFHFHPDLPPSALSLGADLTIQSTHKLLGALSQASMLHCQGSRVKPERISQALQLVQSTSPNYLLLASLDVARYQMVTEGNILLSQTLELSYTVRDKLSKISGLRLLTHPVQALPGFQYLDPTRLTVDVSQWGLTGFEVDEILRQEFQVTAELPTLRQLTFIITFGNTVQDLEALWQAFTILGDRYSLLSNPLLTLPPLPHSPSLLSPRAAFFAETETVSQKAAIARISAELICPYPPGIPVLIPGEVITEEAINYLQQVMKLGGMISGCQDDSLEQFQVIVE